MIVSAMRALSLCPEATRKVVTTVPPQQSKYYRAASFFKYSGYRQAFSDGPEQY
jgi:hypothetical protein